MNNDALTMSLTKDELIEILQGYELVFSTQKTILRVKGEAEPIDDKIYKIYEKYKARLEAILESEKKSTSSG
jgi:hypothetical protein